jgi:hypothetical protein
MFVNSIDTKEFFIKPDGTKVRDLTQTMLDLKNKTYVSYSVYRVPKDYAMRPDLISKSVYNNSIYAEIILKFNGISNPFSINEGDYILIPDLDSAKNKVKESGNTSGANAAERIRNTYKYLDPLKIPKPSEILNQYNSRQIASVPNEALPPNLAAAGTSQVSIRKGRAYFGEGVETCLTNGAPASEFLKNVIQNRK